MYLLRFVLTTPSPSINLLVIHRIGASTKMNNYYVNSIEFKKTRKFIRCIVLIWLCYTAFAAFLVYFIIVSVTVIGELDFNSMTNHIPMYTKMILSRDSHRLFFISKNVLLIMIYL